MSVVADSEEQTGSSMEQACMLCRRAEADPEVCGPTLQHGGIRVHAFCLLFASDLSQNRVEYEEAIVFHHEDVQRAIEQAAPKVCVVCGDSGAAVTCGVTFCHRSFHLPCAARGGCVTQFFGHYMALCSLHSTEQAVEGAGDKQTSCLICTEPLNHGLCFDTLMCPACKHAWFHRDCIQGLALSAGQLCFKCPLCRDRDRFCPTMLLLGIRIPKRLPTWESGEEYNGLMERHSRCDTGVCLCPGGREQEEEEGPWQLLRCCSCAGQGAHRGCSGVGNSTTCWECEVCAGLGTGSSASLDVAGPSAASQPGSGPSRGSPAAEGSSPSPSSWAASGQAPGTGAQETSSPSTGRRLRSGSPCDSPAAKRRRCSSPAGPVRRRQCPCSQRRAQKPKSQPGRRRRERRRVPKPSAGSSSSRTGHRLPSCFLCDSPAPERRQCSSPAGLVRRRDRSRSRLQHQEPDSRPGRRRRERSRVPKPHAGSSSSRTSRRLPSCFLCDSPPPKRSRRSSPARPVRMRDRSRSQLRRREPDSWRGRRPGAEGCHH